MLDLKGFALSVCRLPVVFSTPGIDTITSSDALWFTPDSVSQTLVWPEIVISERAKPVDGDCEFEPITLTLLDDETNTERFTLNQANTPSYLVVSSVNESQTTITVSDASGISTGYAWIDRECVNITSIAGNVLTVQRGKLGTKADVHNLDEGNGGSPELFIVPPWIGVQSTAYLWGIEDDNNAVLLWIGTLKRPVLRDGAVFTLELDHLFSSLRSARVMDRYSGTQLVGLGGSVFPPLRVELRSDSSTVPQIEAINSVLSFRSVHDAVADLCSDSNLNSIKSNFEANSFANPNSFFSLDSNGTGVLFATWTGAPNEPRGGSVTGFPLDKKIEGAGLSDSTNRAIRFNLDLPLCAYVVGTTGETKRYVTSCTGLPLTWDGSTTIVSGRSTRPNRVLIGNISDDARVVFSGIVLDDADSSFESPSTVIRSKVTAGDIGTYAVIRNPALQVGLQVTSDCWIDGWRYGVVPELADTVTGQWDWSNNDRIAQRTTNGLQGLRTQYYTSEEPPFDVLIADCFLAGCTPCTKANGRLSFAEWGLPVYGSDPVKTYDRDDLLGAVQPWELWENGLATSAKVSFDGAVIQVNLVRAVNRFGRNRELSIELKGFDAELLRNIDPLDLKNTILKRLQLWSEPIYTTTIEVSLTDCDEVFLGDTVQLSEWVIPNGDGTRGLTDTLCKVSGKHIDIDQGVLRLDLLMFGRFARGYAPVAKVDSVYSSTGLEFVSNPLGTVAYNGLSGTGLNEFASGDVVQLIQRDSTSPLSEYLTISTIVDPLVFFTTSINGSIQTAITAGDWFSMRPANYSSVQSTQKDHAFVADYQSLKIDGTADDAHRIAP